LGKLVTNLTVVIALWSVAGLAWGGGPLRGLGRVADRAADIVDAGAFAVLHVSEAASGLVHGGMGLGSDLWQGVELRDVIMQKRRGAWRVDDVQVFTSWLCSPAGHATLPLTPAARAAVVDALSPLGLSMPFVAYADTLLDGLGRACQLQASGSLTSSGYIDIKLSYVDANFTAAYMNPLWVCAPERQRVQVIALVAKAVNTTPFVGDSDKPLQLPVGNLGSVVTTTLARSMRGVVLQLRGFAMTLLYGPAA